MTGQCQEVCSVRKGALQRSVLCKEACSAKKRALPGREWGRVSFGVVCVFSSSSFGGGESALELCVMSSAGNGGESASGLCDVVVFCGEWRRVSFRVV